MRWVGEREKKKKYDARGRMHTHAHKLKCIS